MAGTNHGEVSTIQGRDFGDAETFGRCYHRGVDDTERKIGVLLHELGRWCEVRWAGLDE
jgi:hypothetical protein